MLLGQMVDVSFDFGSLMIYLSGILTGVILALLIYVIVILLTINKKRKIIKEVEENINEDDVREMIKLAQDNYLLLSKSKDENIRSTAFKNSCMSLVNDIAKKCFPKSKNPTLEISVDESLLLAKYIIERVEDVLNVRGLRLIKRLTINHLYKLWNVKKKVDNNIVVKEAKKYSKVTRATLNIVSTVTKPFKIIGSETKKFLISKIILLTISIVGEEAYKIYTKQAIKSMDPEYIKLNEEILKDIEEPIETK